MENVFEFLANNYLYFLIAAGVLVFALIGFIVDMKKKSKNETNEVTTGVTNTPVQSEEPIIPELPADVVAGPGNNMEASVETNVNPVVEDATIPGPPMPTEISSEPISMVEPTEQFTPVVEDAMNVSEPVIDMTPSGATTINSTIGEPIVNEVAEPVQTVEEFAPETPVLDLSGVTEPTEFAEQQPIINATDDNN